MKRNPTVDRFTVVYTRANVWGGKDYCGRVFYLGMSHDPFLPQGFVQHGEAWRWQFNPGGSRVEFSSLPSDCQEFVKRDYAELWSEVILGRYRINIWDSHGQLYWNSGHNSRRELRRVYLEKMQAGFSYELWDGAVKLEGGRWRW
jgi:hypothetical protein